MTVKEVTVKFEGGLEARQTAMLVQLASSFDSQIYFEYEGKRVNTKSIMGMLSLGIDENGKVTVYADGADEEAAAKAMEDYLSQKGE